MENAKVREQEGREVKSLEELKAEFTADHVKDSSGQMIWNAYCIQCGEMVDSCPNGGMVEAAARIHTLKTGHEVIVGYQTTRRINVKPEVSKTKPSIYKQVDNNNNVSYMVYEGKRYIGEILTVEVVAKYGTDFEKYIEGELNQSKSAVGK